MTFAMAPSALRLAIPITSSDRFGRKRRGPKRQSPLPKIVFLCVFAPLADEALAKSALREFFSPASLRQLPAFRVDSTQLSHGNLHIPSPLYAIMSSAHYLGLSTQITSRLAIAITGARASFTLRRHLASVKAKGRGESKRGSQPARLTSRTLTKQGL
jgi:hypothetical protein